MIKTMQGSGESATRVRARKGELPHPQGYAFYRLQSFYRLPFYSGVVLCYYSVSCSHMIHNLENQITLSRYIFIPKIAVPDNNLGYSQK